MVDRYRELEGGTGIAAGPALIVAGATDRLAPVLATAGALAIAIAPFAILGNLPGLEIAGPMATVIMAGLATSTMFSLFLVPSVYFRSGPSPELDPASQLVEQPSLMPV